MKKLIASLGLLLMAHSPLFADITVRELFRVTEGKVIDWAIASSIEPVYYMDFIDGGKSKTGAQFPIVYVIRYLSADFGYLTGATSESRATLAIGGSLRINKILEDIWPNKVYTIKSFLPQKEDIFDRLFFGPYISHSFVDGDLGAGLKMGLEF